MFLRTSSASDTLIIFSFFSLFLVFSPTLARKIRLPINHSSIFSFIPRDLIAFLLRVSDVENITTYLNRISFDEILTMTPAKDKCVFFISFISKVSLICKQRHSFAYPSYLLLYLLFFCIYISKHTSVQLCGGGLFACSEDLGCNG